MAQATYADDLAFCQKHAQLIELTNGAARVVVAPDWQGRVMTSSLAGADGASFGWVHRAFIDAGQTGTAFDNYGGEDRFWLGPEAGQFGLWFAPGEPFDLDHWTTPDGFNTGAFAVDAQDAASVALSRRFSVTNAGGTSFDCSVWRTIELIGADRASTLLGVDVPDGVSMVGFASINQLGNAGEKPWTREAGLLSVWILGQFKPLANGKVIVPFVAGDEATLGTKVTTDYFGELPPERCHVGEYCVLFTVDGQHRSKIGISPARAKDVLGSYDPDGKVLTIVQFSLPAGAAELPYVNSLWEQQDEPFAGDAVNSYNDGPPEPGAAPLGPFYEIETSSPAAELAPGESITHTHRTFHFAGKRDALDALSRALLGASLADIV
ncbi:MAG: hypothetical protein KGY99_07285 [Phycisphaerae bacterium]|nr:hypothetical protein [Phycisphaerae bacterium]